jgi:hypothetical protein
MTERPAAGLLAAFLVWAGCSPRLVYSPVPDPYRLAEGPDAPIIGNMIEMADPAAEFHLVRDVSRVAEGGGWRWSGARPELWFVAERGENQQFVLDFAVAERTIQETGPLTIRVSLNGRPLGARRCDRHGRYEFRTAVPEDWLRSLEINKVEIEIDKPWRDPTDGRVYGIILMRAGFAP